MKIDVTSALQKKATQVGNATAILIESTNDWQVIRQYLSNRLAENKLTDKQLEKLERYQYAYNQLVSGRYTDQDVLHQLMNIFKIKVVQAYDDLNCTREIFSTVFNINKRFEQRMELESARNMKRKCEEMGDFKSAAMLQKNIIQLLRDIPDLEENPADMFEGHTIEATFDPSLLGAAKIDMNEVLQALNAKRKVKIKIDMFEELNYTEEPDK